ncbi:hypothetical protein ACLM5J_06815 [Nocardioides sp. Bht2]|uniref:hypothetical protein n=1 Tax=Nocardioides sp. Bht2 TaxID=3392297 RepID=UPI0039B542E2
MRKPEVPKDWLVFGIRWGVQVPGMQPEDRWLGVGQMDGASEATASTLAQWRALRRSSQIQDAICEEINRRLPLHGYRTRSELAWKGDATAAQAKRRTQIGLGTLRNILSGQRFMTLREIAEFEALLGGNLLTIARLDSSRDRQETDRVREQAQQRYGTPPAL